MKATARLILAGLSLLAPAAVFTQAPCNAGLSSTYLGTTCRNNPPSYGSVKVEWNPAEIRNCTVQPATTGKKCVTASVMFQKKTTVYSDANCTGSVVWTSEWVNAGNFAYDSLCTCP